MENCTRCELLVKEVERTTNGRNDWFDRCAKAEREVEKLTADLKRCAKERDEWIGHYQRAKAERAGIDYSASVSKLNKPAIEKIKELFVPPGSIAFDLGELEERIAGYEVTPKCDPRYSHGPNIPGGSL